MMVSELLAAFATIWLLNVTLEISSPEDASS